MRLFSVLKYLALSVREKFRFVDVNVCVFLRFEPNEVIKLVIISRILKVQNHNFDKDTIL